MDLNMRMVQFHMQSDPYYAQNEYRRSYMKRMNVIMAVVLVFSLILPECGFAAVCLAPPALNDLREGMESGQPVFTGAEDAIRGYHSADSQERAAAIQFLAENAMHNPAAVCAMLDFEDFKSFYKDEGLSEQIEAALLRADTSSPAVIIAVLRKTTNGASPSARAQARKVLERADMSNPDVLAIVVEETYHLSWTGGNRRPDKAEREVVSVATRRIGETVSVYNYTQWKDRRLVDVCMQALCESTFTMLEVFTSLYILGFGDTSRNLSDGQQIAATFMASENHKDLSVPAAQFIEHAASAHVKDYFIRYFDILSEAADRNPSVIARLFLLMNIYAPRRGTVDSESYGRREDIMHGMAATILKMIGVDCAVVTEKCGLLRGIGSFQALEGLLSRSKFACRNESVQDEPGDGSTSGLQELFHVLEDQTTRMDAAIRLGRMGIADPHVVAILAGDVATGAPEERMAADRALESIPLVGYLPSAIIDRFTENHTPGAVERLRHHLDRMDPGTTRAYMEEALRQLEYGDMIERRDAFDWACDFIKKHGPIRDTILLWSLLRSWQAWTGQSNSVYYSERIEELLRLVDIHDDSVAQMLGSIAHSIPSPVLTTHEIQMAQRLLEEAGTVGHVGPAEGIKTDMSGTGTHGSL